MSGVHDDLMYEVPGSRLRELREAEARCARLQQALESIVLHVQNAVEARYSEQLDDIETVAREALAGLDTPADSQPDWSKCDCGAGPFGIHAKRCALVADSQPEDSA